MVKGNRTQIVIKQTFFLMLLSSLFLTQSICIAQNASDLVQVTGERTKYKGSLAELHKASDGTFWSLSYRNADDQYFLMKFDQNLNFLEQKRQIFKYYTKVLDFHSFVELKGKTYAFLTYYNKKKKKTYLFAVQFNISEFAFEREVFMVANLTNKGRRYTDPKFELKTNSTGSHILIKGTNSVKYRFTLREKIKGRNKEKPIRYSMWVLDSSIQIVNHIGRYRLSGDISNKDYTLVDFDNGADGTIYTIGLRLVEKKYSARERRQIRKGKMLPSNQSTCVLEKISRGQKIIQYITDTSIYYKDMEILMDGPTLNLIGLYAIDFGYYKGNTGLSRIQIDTTNLNVIEETYQNFGEDIIRKVNGDPIVLSARRRKRVEKQIASYSEEQLKRLEAIASTMRSSSGIVYCKIGPSGVPIAIVEEQTESYEVTYYSDGTTSTKTFYHFDDMVVASFDYDTVLMGVIKKSQTYSGSAPDKTFAIALGEDFNMIKYFNHIQLFTDDLEEIVEVNKRKPKSVAPYPKKSYCLLISETNDNQILTAFLNKGKIFLQLSYLK